MIVIDSDSSDKTVDIVEGFKKKFPDLKIIGIRKQDFNHGETRNLGVKTSKGKFVCFFSQDAIPKNSRLFQYYLEDFDIDNKVVAVFGKHIPYENTPLIQKLEVLCRWEKLDKYANQKGRLIQDAAKPFIPFIENNKLLWYALSNTSSCYRKAFLMKFPFPEIKYGEDLIMGKTIIERGFIKIYDTRCAVFHSHIFNIPQYYDREQADLNFRRSLIGKYPKTNIFCKIKKIINLHETMSKKIEYLIELFMYYAMKLAIILKKR